MNELFPIIRRKRRPLVEPDVPPVVVGNVEPVKATARDEDGGLRMENGMTPAPTTKPSDADVSITSESR